MLEVTVELIMYSLTSLGRMHPCIPYALFAQMDRNSCVKTTMPNGPQSMGYVFYLILSDLINYYSLISYCRAEGGIVTRTTFFFFFFCFAPRTIVSLYSTSTVSISLCISKRIVFFFLSSVVSSYDLYFYRLKSKISLQCQAFAHNSVGRVSTSISMVYLLQHFYAIMLNNYPIPFKGNSEDHS